MNQMRLDRYLSKQKIASRSKIKHVLKQKIICVNGIRYTDGSVKVSPGADIVTVDGEEIIFTKFDYIMLNKPMGVITATKDNSVKTVLDLIGDDVSRKLELFPVGRLDKDTTGLLLLTNDGELNHRLLSPSHHVAKKYLAVVDYALEDFEDIVGKFSQGVDIGDDKDTLPALLEKADIENGYYLTITEGRHHQVKRMFRAFGRTVVSLKRISMGSLILDESLDEGSYRFLTKEEIDKLKIS